MAAQFCGFLFSKMPVLCSLDNRPVSKSISYRYLSFLRITSVSVFVAYVYSQAYALSFSAAKNSAQSSTNGFLIAFCGVSVALNIYWLGQLFFDWDVDGNTLPLKAGWDEDLIDLQTDEKHPFVTTFTDNDPRLFSADLSSAQVRCLPLTIMGNLIMIAWSYAWSHEHHVVAQVLLSLNLAALLYGVFMLLHVEQDDIITPSNLMTHLVMKTGTGLAVLFMWTNYGIFNSTTTPEMAEIVNNGILFLLMTIGSGPDPTLGICIIYNLMALLSGNSTSVVWARSFQVIAGLVATCLVIEFQVSRSERFWWIKGFSRPSQWTIESDDLGKLSLDNDFSSAHLISALPVWYTPSIVPSLSYHNWTVST